MTLDNKQKRKQQKPSEFNNSNLNVVIPMWNVWQARHGELISVN